MLNSAEMEIFCAHRETCNSIKREQLKDGFIPAGPTHLLESGSSYIKEIDSRWRRFYQKSSDVNGNCPP